MAIREIDPSDLKCVQGGGSPGIPDGQRIGDYTQVTRGFGLFSLSDTTYRDRNTGEQFTASSWGIGPNLPGWSVSTGNVYRSESQPPDTTVRSVVTGPGFQGGFGDSTSVSGLSASNGYSLQTGGSPYFGMEYTHTNEGITTVPPNAPAGLNPSEMPIPNNLPDTTPTSQDLYGDVPNLTGGAPETNYNQYSELGPNNELDQQYRADHANDAPTQDYAPSQDYAPTPDAGANESYQDTGTPDGGDSSFA